MTILEAITKIQNVKPNQYDDELMVEWLSDLDGMIYHEYIKWHLKPRKEQEEPPAEEEPQALPEKAPLGDMSWADVLAIANAGEAKEYFNTHDTKTIYFDEPVLGSDSIVVEIAGFDYDDLADGSGKAPISFLMKGMFSKTSQMHNSSSTAVPWPDTYFYTTVLPAVRNAIVNAVGADVISPVIKTSLHQGLDEKSSVAVTVWQPSRYEVSQVSYMAEEAPTGIDYCYPIFDALDDSTRIKYHPAGSAYDWWVRSAFGDGDNYCVSSAGQASVGQSQTASLGIVLGFCVGKVEKHEEEEEPERERWPYDPELDMDTTLLVPEPYSNLYVKYLAAQVDYFNGELARYNNSMVMFNTALSAFADWYNRSNMPNQDNFIRF